MAPSDDSMILEVKQMWHMGQYFPHELATQKSHFTGAFINKGTTAPLAL